MSGNVIDLCEARKKKFPTKEEIVSHLAEMIEVSDYFEKDVAASLLELFESDMLDVTRTSDGEFLYALRKDVTQSGGSCEGQDISLETKYDNLVDELCDAKSPGPNFE